LPLEDVMLEQLMRSLDHLFDSNRARPRLAQERGGDLFIKLSKQQ
jgi:hypothetical protein